MSKIKESLLWSLEDNVVEHGDFLKVAGGTIGFIVGWFPLIAPALITMPLGWIIGDELKNNLKYCAQRNAKGEKWDFYCSLHRLCSSILEEEIEPIQETAQEMGLPFKRKILMDTNRDYYEHLSVNLPVKRIVGWEENLRINRERYLQNLNGVDKNYRQRLEARNEINDLKRSRIHYPLLTDLDDAYEKLTQFNEELHKTRNEGLKL